MKARIGPAPPSLCWQCLNRLQRAPGRGKGLFFFHIVRDRAGVEHRVHATQCLDLAIADGNTLVKP